MRSATAVTGVFVGGTALVAAASFVLATSSSGGVAGAALGLSVSVPEKYKKLVNEEGNRCPEVSPNLLAALLTQESGFNRHAKSGAGAKGIAQFLPSTWSAHAVDGDGDGDRDIWDPKDAIPSAAKYLCTLAKDVKGVPGDPQKNILAAYNSGPGAVRKYGGVPPYKETQTYVKNITALAAKPGPYGSGSGESKDGETVSAEQAAVAVNHGQEMLGTPYSWGGGSVGGPTTGTCCSPRGSSGRGAKGFDCSGLTMYAYAKVGIRLPRTASAQYRVSKHISQGEMRPGDLIFYGSGPDSLHHVGIYVGGDYMLNAARPGTKVRFDSIDSMSDLYGVARPQHATTTEV
ncbi:bifunctional lytic transglycosylase/C40 family peptidase [Streptomyces sp. MNP-20]|uniref:C40 family peptidase n=1 Tax=Streptomyces sp. MNP-20 TaxID=2721165 RepID=UPI0015556BF5|nr:bifunctional lytic transglycosylase/C40 family peptidase [Streptomyces sp. MNP-20]